MTEEVFAVVRTEEPDSLIGTTLAERYQIQSIIGEGGMGLVYKARHVLMNRLVAIKMIRSEYISNPTAVQRFEQEAKAISALDHPNIVTVYDYGISPDGRPYLVMDFLEGISLADLIHSEGKLPLDRALRLAIQACQALEHAHHKSILHRDFKASNIMIVRHGKDGETVKIVDFGMAKLLRREDGSERVQELTQVGDVFGSPLYMSPEQCRGQILDVRSDIYSLGCVMYYMFAGDPPILGENMLDTMQKQIHTTPVPCSTVAGHSKFPQALDRVISQTLRKEPEDRYQAVSPLLQDLLSVQSGGDKTIAKNTVELKKTKKREPMKVHMAVTVGLMVVCVGLTSFVSGRIFEDASAEQEANMWVDFTQDAERARREKDYMTAERLFLSAVTEAQKFGKYDPRLAKSLVALGSTYEENHQFSKADAYLKRAVNVLEKCYGKDAMELSPALLALGKSYMEQGRYREAEDLHRKALALLETEFGSEHEKVLSALDQYAALKRCQGDDKGAHQIEARLQSVAKARLKKPETKI